MRVVNKNEMNDIEELSKKEFFFDEGSMLENVGMRGADFIEDEFLGNGFFEELVFFIGHGKTGADALSVARHLRNRGFAVRAFLLFENPVDILKTQIEMAKAYGVKIGQLNNVEQLKSYFTQTQQDFFIVDGILGTGYRSPLSNFLFDLIKVINSNAHTIVSIDIPTGVDADTGAVDGVAIKANCTLAITLPKIGYYIGQGPKQTGIISLIESGVSEKIIEGGDKGLLLIENIGHIFKKRSKFAHKNTFGHSLIIGGSPGMTGASLMASLASLKVGTGLVTSATWKESYYELTSRMTPEIMTGLVPTDKDDVEEIIRELEKFDSIVIGPGMGRDEKTRNSTLKVLSSFSGPVVVDADAIHMLKINEDFDVLKTRKGATVLTPHIGEFANFLNLSTKEILESPIKYLKFAVEKTNSVIVLKGACTYIGFPSGEVLVNYYPNDGLATGGSGDVLAGVIGGFLAQATPDKTDIKRSSIFKNDEAFYHAICLGVGVHTLSGKIASEKLGNESMSAGDLINCLSDSFKELKEEEK